MVTIQDIYFFLIPLTYLISGTQYIIALLTFSLIIMKRYISRENIKLFSFIFIYSLIYLSIKAISNNEIYNDSFLQKSIPVVIRINLFYLLFITLMDADIESLINSVKKYSLIYGPLYMVILLFFNTKGLSLLTNNQLWFDESNILQLYWTPPLLVLLFLSIRKNISLVSLIFIFLNLFFSVCFAYSTIYLCQIGAFIILFFNDIRNYFTNFIAGAFAKFSIKKIMILILPILSTLVITSQIPGKIYSEYLNTSIRTAAIVDMFDEYNKQPLLGYGFGMTESISKNTFGNEFIEKFILKKTPDEKIKIMSSPVEMVYEGGIVSILVFISLLITKIRNKVKVNFDQFRMLFILFIPSITVPSYYFTPMFIFTAVTIIKLSELNLRSK